MSVDSNGVEGDGQSENGHRAVSHNGSYVVFQSSARNLEPPDSSVADIFLHDCETGATTLISRSTSGEQGIGESRQPSITPSGRYVVFESEAPNLVAGDTNGRVDVFHRDLVTGVTTRVNLDSNGSQDFFGGAQASVSDDGRFVAFISYWNLTPEDTNSFIADVYVRDVQLGVTTLVSLDDSGLVGNDESLSPSLSGNGRFVAFQSRATNLVPGGTSQPYNTFVRDLEQGTTELVSVTPAGGEGDGPSLGASLSYDGRFVAFVSRATNLVVGDTEDRSDVFVRDRLLGVTRRVSVSPTGEGGEFDSGPDSQPPSISADGQVVAFRSLARNLAPGDVGFKTDIYVFDATSGRAELWSRSLSGESGNENSQLAAISPDGRSVVFTSYATNLVSSDENGYRDVFLASRCAATSLSLRTEPDSPVAGEGVTFTAVSDDPGALGLLVLIELRGLETFLPIAFGTFDGTGVWSVSGNVPLGLAGVTALFQIATLNGLSACPSLSVTFQ